MLDFLRQAIISGRLAPGSRLVERELIEMMDVSRTVIREALRQLETEGLVATIANKGPGCARIERTGEAKDLYAIREVSGRSGRAAIRSQRKRRSTQVAEGGSRRGRRCYTGGRPVNDSQAKNNFYDALVAGAGSELLISMISILHARISRWRALGLTHPKRSPKRSRESVISLRAMFAAIKAGNAQLAEKLAREETAHAAAEVMRLLSE